MAVRVFLSVPVAITNCQEYLSAAVRIFFRDAHVLPGEFQTDSCLFNLTALGSFLKHAIASFATKSLALDIRLTSLNHEAFSIYRVDVKNNLPIVAPDNCWTSDGLGVALIFCDRNITKLNPERSIQFASDGLDRP
ncbi:hypothetical protein RU639_004652 [Aspergillus parasiticus]